MHSMQSGVRPAEPSPSTSLGMNYVEGRCGRAPPPRRFDCGLTHRQTVPGAGMTLVPRLLYIASPASAAWPARVGRVLEVS